MKFVITTKYAMKAKVTTIANGKVTNHRGFVDAETWIPGKVEFLKNIYKFDDCKVERTETGFIVRCKRSAGIPGTRGKAMDVTHILTLVD